MILINIKNITSYRDITSLAIGHFDGMHIAHQELFSHLDTNGAILSIGIENSILTPVNFRDKFIDKTLFGIYLYDVKHLKADEFLTIVQTIFPKLQKIIIGYDFKIGKDRHCDIPCIKQSINNIELKIIDEIKLDNISVHSKIIKELILSSSMIKASRFLGRYYSITGDIIKGQGIGKTDFVPTINIKNNHNFLLPPDGVYATNTIIDDIKYNSLSFIGKRQSTDNNFAIETHIIEKDIFIEKISSIEIIFIEKIRDNEYFKDKNVLKKQIKQDILRLKDIIKK
jgi:riboflavin kinase/FMN adenylyltransferase